MQSLQMRTFITIIFLLLIYNSALAQRHIVTEESKVEFIATNLGIKYYGTMPEITGKIAFDINNIDASDFRVTIQVKSIEVKSETMYKHLMGEDFFYEEEFPVITFQSTSTQKMDNELILKGELSMKGKKKTIEIPFTQEEGLFLGSFELDRTDFEIGGNGFMNPIGDKVKINIVCTTKES